MLGIKIVPDLEIDPKIKLLNIKSNCTKILTKNGPYLVID